MKIIATNSSILVQKLTRMVTLQPYLQGSKSKSFIKQNKFSIVILKRENSKIEWRVAKRKFSDSKISIFGRVY